MWFSSGLVEACLPKTDDARRAWIQQTYDNPHLASSRRPYSRTPRATPDDVLSCEGQALGSVRSEGFDEIPEPDLQTPWVSSQLQSQSKGTESWTGGRQGRVSHQDYPRETRYSLYRVLY